VSDMSDLHLFQTLDLPEATAPTSAEVTAEAEDNDLASALAILWRRHRQTNLDRISLLEATAANVLRTAVADDAIADGAKAAHMLAGSLGTFGLDDGSRAALEAEFLLKQTVIDGRLLAEAVTALRESVEGVGDDPGSGAGQTRSDGSVGGAAVMVVSVDAELVARLAVEAGAVGLSITSSAEVPSADSLRFGVITSVIVDEDVFRDADGSALMNSVAELSRKALVFALTDRVSFEDRVELARAGASAVMSRSQGARQILSFLTETLARRRPVRSTVLAYHANAKFVESLREALSDSSCRLEVRHDPSSFWEALEEPGADLVVVGSDGPQLSGTLSSLSVSQTRPFSRMRWPPGPTTTWAPIFRYVISACVWTAILRGQGWFAIGVTSITLRVVKTGGRWSALWIMSFDSRRATVLRSPSP